MKLLSTISKIRKRDLLITLGILYLSTLTMFGVVYWRIANISAGEFFVFQNDININTKISVFKKNLKLNIYNRDFNNTISELISSEEYKRSIVKLNADEQKIKDKNFFIFTLDKPLGEVWANYYYLLLQGKGITHMKIESAREQVINNKFHTHKLKITLYKMKKDDKDENFILFRKEDKDKFEKKETITIWVKDYKIIDEELFDKDYSYFPLSFYFTNLIENSISFLDESPIVLKGVANGSFKYPLWNFLYFSAVTITTLGYGDILPNSTLVRVLVMFETIFGVVIIGMFASCLFWNKKN